MGFKTTIIGLLFIFLTAGQAAAQPGATSSWEGQYLGLGLGGAWGEADPSVHAKKTTYFSGNDPALLNPQGSYDMDLTDLTGNLFWGLNGQKDKLVYGVEINLSLTDYNETHHSGNIAYQTLPTDTFSMTTHVKSDWAVSIRPRVGYALEKSLVYVTAGPALRQFEYDFSFADRPTWNQSLHISDTKWRLGLTGGFGYEYQIRDTWSVRTEYLFSIYRNAIDTQSQFASQPADGFTHDLDFMEHSLSIGLSKRF